MQFPADVDDLAGPAATANTKGGWLMRNGYVLTSAATDFISLSDLV